jgi:hypothetical protein
MILFDLTCGREHVFEAWFRDGAAYEAQRKGRKIACPVCGDSKVSKAPMAPRIGKGNESDTGNGSKAGEALRMLRQLRQDVESKCDYVGPRFPEEARRIHYGESEKRGIYGEASPDEARSLADEGIEVARIPWVPRQDS